MEAEHYQLTQAQKFGLAIGVSTTSKFKLNTTDATLLALRAEYQDFLYSSYAHFCMPLDFWDVTLEVPKKHQNGRSYAKWFAFAIGWEPPHVLQVKLVTRAHSDRHILVRFNQKWSLFHRFLESFTPENPPVDNERLWLMWQSNGKNFPLFTLPRELRDKIYREVVFDGGDGRVFPSRCGLSPGPHAHLGIVRHRTRHNLDIFATRRPSVRLYNDGVLDSKRGYNTCTKGEGGSLQLYEEAVEVLYSSGKFEFTHPKQFRRIFHAAGPEHFRMIHEIEFDFHHAEYLKALGLKVNQTHNYHVCPAMEALKSLNLRRLCIWIPPPISLHSFTSGHIPLWDSETGRGCHTKTVQWILDLLLPLIAHLDVHSIEVCGYIRGPQKRRFFEALTRHKDTITEPTTLAEEVQDDGEEGGVPLDEADNQQLLTMDNNCLLPTEESYKVCTSDHEEFFPDIELQVTNLIHEGED
jgi:hypothetical protein